MTKRFFTFLLICFFAFGVVTCSNSSTSPSRSPTATSPTATATSNADEPVSKMQIWWTQGFLPEENEVIIRLVADWKKESGYEADLVLLPDRDILHDTQNAVEEGHAPDILFSYEGDTNLIPWLAWNGKLADVSELIQSYQTVYSPVALEAVNYLNNVTKQRSYYAVPFAKQTVHLHFWENLIEEAGFSRNDIPQQWDEFWAFWQQVQDRLRQKGVDSVYGLGLSLSDLGVDTLWVFEHFLEAHNVQVVDTNGQLQLDKPGVKEAIANIIQEFANFYKDQYVPPKALEWTDSGNNVSFLESRSVMTANSTLSIPLTQKQPDNSYNQLSKDLYFDKIRTTLWPQKPDGQVLRSILSIKQVALLEDSEHRKEAMSFLAYFSKPERVSQFLQLATKGRFFPVMPELLKDQFWNDPNDPHKSVALKQYEQPTRPSYQVYAPAYSQVLKDNVWAKAILSVIENGTSPQQAADEAIAQIKKTFAEWT
jgi:multiple sugar transport system substrate-binding protein